MKTPTTEPTETEWWKRYMEHCESVTRPLPFELFKIKSRLLDLFLIRDPDGHDNSLDASINRLSRELGV